MNNILYVSPEDRLSNAFMNGLVKRMMLRLGQRSVVWITDLLPKFFRAGELRLDTSAGTVVTAKIFLQLSEHGRFVGYQKYFALIHVSLPSLEDIYAEQVVNLVSDLDGSEDIFEASKVYLK